MKDYKQKRKQYINDPIRVIYEYYIDKGGYLDPSQFMFFFQDWLVGTGFMNTIDLHNQIERVLNTLDVEHEVTLVEYKNRIIDVV